MKRVEGFEVGVEIDVPKDVLAAAKQRAREHDDMDRLESYLLDYIDFDYTFTVSDKTRGSDGVKTVELSI